MIESRAFSCLCTVRYLNAKIVQIAKRETTSYSTLGMVTL